MAVGDQVAVADVDIETVTDARGHVVAPGFVDPHGHSDANVLLDGVLASHPVLGRGVPHPHAFGSPARVLGRYVRERGVLRLDTAVAKLSSVSAAQVGLRDRGPVCEGWVADLVVFDPVTVIDAATFGLPAQYATGIRDMVVNGRLAVRGGTETGARPGRLLRRDT